MSFGTRLWFVLSDACFRDRSNENKIKPKIVQCKAGSKSEKGISHKADYKESRVLILMLTQVSTNGVHNEEVYLCCPEPFHLL